LVQIEEQPDGEVLEEDILVGEAGAGPEERGQTGEEEGQIREPWDLDKVRDVGRRMGDMERDCGCPDLGLHCVGSRDEVKVE
jgi:hypothetical protein